MRKIKLGLLLTILIAAFVVRLYRINRPVGDWHSWRQADTASVTRNYVKYGINLLVPTYDDLSSIPSGKDNPNGFRMVEFPVINALSAYVYTLLPNNLIPLVTFLRLVSVVFSLGSLYLLYTFLKHHFGWMAVATTTLVFAFLPYNIFYSTVILPEVPFVFFIMLAVWSWDRYTLKPGNLMLIVFCLASILALLIKPYYLFMLPAFIYLLIKRQGFARMFQPKLLVAALITAVPFFLWRFWIARFPEGIPAYDWLLNSTHIRFKGAFFRWLFADRFGRLILGYWGVLPLGLGIILRPNKTLGWFLHLWLLGLIAYLCVFATGNVTHDYYQIIFTPIISILVGLGLAELLRPKSVTVQPFLSVILAITAFFFMEAFGWFHVRDYFNINNPDIVLAGQFADRLLPSDAKVVAPYGGDTAFLFQTNRSGWPIGGEILKRITQGATAYVSTNYDQETRALMDRCRILQQQPNFVIIDLTACDVLNNLP